MSKYKKLAGCAGTGGGLGYVVTKATGMKAVGVLIGKGAGLGSPAGPVGIAVGVLCGLAFYGVYKLYSDDD